MSSVYWISIENTDPFSSLANKDKYQRIAVQNRLTELLYFRTSNGSHEGTVIFRRPQDNPGAYKEPSQWLHSVLQSSSRSDHFSNEDFLIVVSRSQT